MTDDVAIRDYQSPLAENDQWWGIEADDVEGYDLVKDKALFSLVGVPFLIYRLTFRPGLQAPKTAWRNDFVSAETRVAPASVIVRQFDRILSRRTGDLIADPRAIPDPGEQLVLNDGSTGLYRQCVEYAEAKGYITVPDDLPAIGAKNECRYDLPVTEMDIPEDAPNHKVEVRFTPNGEKVVVMHTSLRCMRGLRYSDYENPSNPKERATTFYLG